MESKGEVVRKQEWYLKVTDSLIEAYIEARDNERLVLGKISFSPRKNDVKVDWSFAGQHTITVEGENDDGIS